jgi:RNA polymerase sigma-70 factor (ECF subfamily)
MNLRTNQGASEQTITEVVQPPMAVADEKTLILRALAGDGTAFNQLVVAYQRLAYRVAYRILHSAEAAADAVQDAWLKAFRALPTYRGENFKPWLLRIVIYTCYDVLKAQRRQPMTSLDALPGQPEFATALVARIEQPEAYAERMELRQWLEAGIRTLPADQRLAFVLRYVQGYSYEEVATITGASMGTVKSRLNRSRSRLRTSLLQHDVW